MPLLSSHQDSIKPASRFSSLNVLRLRSGSGPGSLDVAPPPPPKDSSYTSSPNPSFNPPSAFYNKPFFSRSAASLSPSLSPDTISGPATPSSPFPPMPSAGFEFGKRSNTVFVNANGGGTASPVPSASGGSFRSISRNGGEYLSAPSMDGSTDSSSSSPHASARSSSNLGAYLSNGASSSSYTLGQATAPGAKPKRSVFKLANLAKRNRSRKDLSDTTSASGSVSRSTSVSGHEPAAEKAGGDEGITTPWNFQHHIHVDEGYIGLPPSWSAALSQVGFSEEEITAIHARRRAAASGFASSTDLTSPHIAHSHERPPSPQLIVTALSTSTSVSSSATLLEPVPRSTSLGKGRSALEIHPTSVYSITGSTTAAGPSPGPSPRAPSFSMKSIVSGIKNSLTSDLAYTKDSGDPLRSGGATNEESDQYVLVDGDSPGGAGDQRMGDETLIEPYPFDSSSVFSLHTHSPRLRQTSQDQQTPRTPTFPQIQVHRAQSEAGHVASPSPTSHAPSPLSHSHSLPTPTPPRGYTHPDLSVFPSSSNSNPRLGPLSTPPRASSRRIYHVVNSSSDSYEGENFAEPPPAYASLNKEEWTPRKEKEGSTIWGGPPPPNRPIPPVPAERILGEPSGVGIRDSMVTDQEVSAIENSDYSMGSSFGNIPGTADEVLDISSHYSGNSVHGGDAEMDPAQPTRVLSPTPPLVIDKRMAKLAMLPPRISFHQEGDLEGWSESLFSAIHSKGNRTSVLIRPQTGDAANVREERRTTIRPMSRRSTAGESGSVSPVVSNSLSTDPTPTLPDISFGANLTLGSHTKPTVDAVEEGDEQDQVEDKAEETKIAHEHDAGEPDLDIDVSTTTREVERTNQSPVAPSTPLLPDVSLGPNVSSLGKDLEVPPAVSSPPPESPNRADPNKLPPSTPSKQRPKPAPLALPSSSALAPPRTNIITGISGRSPVNALFGAKPQPLPIPIPLSQIRTQLRPAPPKSPHPPPTLPLPPLRRIPSQPGFQPPLLPSQLTPTSSPQRGPKQDSTPSQASPSDSLSKPSRTLQPAQSSPGDRDSGLSTITVTPATITTAKTEVVRTAVASFIESDTVSLASRRGSAASTADTGPQTLTYDKPDIGAESPRSQEQGEAPDDSLLNDGPQSKWPAPPPPPVELETDSTPHRVSRFRSTSLGRVSQILAMVSPVGYQFPHKNSDAALNSPSESTPPPIPNGTNGASSSAAPKMRLAVEAELLSSRTNTFGGVDVEVDGRKDSEPCLDPSETGMSEPRRSIPPVGHPLLSQLQPYITPRNPESCFTNLVEIAEGESGSVFAARVAPSYADFRPQDRQEDIERPLLPGTSHVAIKRIPLPLPSSVSSLSDDSPVSNKLVSVLHELCLLKNLDHEHLLLLDAVYVSPSSTEAEGGKYTRAVDTSLWIRMELMERSLADVIGLVAEGLALQERLVGRFASDVLHGLDYLQRQHIAHRDVRSDNLLVNAAGAVKLADFSSSVRVDRNAPMVDGAVGVIYWQAPEMRAGPYDALKVDVWSLGATVWELAETVPPFSVHTSPSTQMTFAMQTIQHVGPQWPPLTHPEHYSRAFHEFLKLCGRESATRPNPGELLNTQFIRNACGRPVILQLLSQCRAIEEAMADKEAPAGQA